MRPTVCDTVGPEWPSRSEMRARSGTIASSSSSRIVRRYISVVSIRSVIMPRRRGNGGRPAYPIPVPLRLAPARRAQRSPARRRAARDGMIAWRRLLAVRRFAHVVAGAVLHLRLLVGALLLEGARRGGLAR